MTKIYGGPLYDTQIFNFDRQNLYSIKLPVEYWDMQKYSFTTINIFLYVDIRILI